MDTDALLKEIRTVFPLVEMPSGAELMFHQDDCFECNDLREDLEQYRGKEVTVVVIRMLHQEMPHLSAKGWRWILPHYLQFSVTPEAEYSQMETEFLIYNLRPAPEFQKKTAQRLSTLDKAQLDCLIHFLDWCLNQTFWKEYCPEDIKRAINFLSTIKA